MQLWRCKPTNTLTITSANYLHLHTEQLFRTHKQFIRKNFKIMSMEKWRFWVLTCKVLIHDEVAHNKLLLNTSAFLFNFFFSQSTFSFHSIYIICLISHKTDMRSMWQYFKQIMRKIKKLFISRKFYVRRNNSWIYWNKALSYCSFASLK